MDRQKKAFTIVEVIMVLSIFLVTGALFMPFSISNINSTRTDSTITLIVSAISTTQKRGYASLNNKAHAIRINTESISYLSGDDINSLIEDNEIEFDIGVQRKSITLTGGSDTIYFEKGEFKPTQIGEFVIGDEVNEWKILINAEGMIDYYKL